MRPQRLGLFLATFLTLVATAAARAQPLIGDPVPDLAERVDWPVGEAVPAFEPGSVYLIDFWATWCPPCYPMIDQLSELQTRYRQRGLVVIGVAVGTDVGTPLPRFLEREEERIRYAIARPTDDESLQRLLVHPRIMDPADFALPFVMLVDRQGRLAWVSDPAAPAPEQHDALEAAVESLVDGSFDLEAAIARQRKELDGIGSVSELLAEAASLRRGSRLEEAADSLVSASSLAPDQSAEAAMGLFQELLCRDRSLEASAFARRLLATPIGDRIPELVVLERSILALGDPGSRDLELAEEVARRALELQGGNHPDFLFELAKILTAQGDPGAEGFRRRAVEAATNQGWDDGYIRFISAVGLDTAIRQQAMAFAGTCDPYLRTEPDGVG